MIFRKEQPIPEEAVSLREQRAMQGDRLSTGPTLSPA